MISSAQKKKGQTQSLALLFVELWSLGQLHEPFDLRDAGGEIVRGLVQLHERCALGLEGVAAPIHVPLTISASGFSSE